MLSLFPSLADIFNEILAGAVGGLIMAAAALALRFHKRRKLERRFPVSGSYISFYEDIENGARVVVASRAEVRQSGAAVRIVNDTAEGRSWTLEGTILPGGHISGVYSADADYDEGVGAFYLRVGKNLLDGMWSGYDHVNKITTSGRYWFNRLLPVDIREAADEDVNDILHTSGNAFGFGYVDPAHLVNDDRHFAVVAHVEKEFAGFCFGHLLDADGVADLVGTDVGILPDDIRLADAQGRLGVLKSIAIRRKFRGHGVGARLVAEAERRLKTLGAGCIVVPAWKVGAEIPIANLLRRADYAEWLSNDRYWRDSCEAGAFKCVAFDGACRCAATFFRKGRF